MLSKMKAVAKIIISMLLLLQFCIYTAAQNVGINQLNPQYPLDILAGQGVIRMITTDSSFGSVIELKNINTASQYLGAVNFNDSTNNHPGQIGYLTNHNLTFRTNLGERMRIDHLGRIGIGTAVPQWPIDIRANQGVVGITSTVANFGSGLELRSLNTAADYLGAINFNDSLGSYPGQIGYLSNHNLTFRTGQLERMRINSLGHVGIGTTSPEWPIDVVANNAIARFRATSVDGSGIMLRNMASTPDLLGYLEFQGPSGQPGSWIGGLPNKDLFFVVNNSECVRISAAGRLGVGCSTPVWPIHIKANQGVIGITSTTANLGSGVELQNLNPAAEYIGAINFNDSIGSYPGQIGYLSNHNLTFRTSQLERMRIDPFGRIGIGT